MEAGVAQARDGLLGRCIARANGGGRDARGLEAVGGHLDRNVTRTRGADDAHELSGPGIAIVIAVGLVVGRGAVIHARQFAGARDLELHVVLRVGDNVAVLVLDAHSDVGKVAVGRDLRAVHSGLELGCRAGSGHALAAVPVRGREFLTVLVICLCPDGAVRIGDAPREVEVLVVGVALVGTLVDLVGVAGIGGLLGELLLAERLGLGGPDGREEELDLGGVGVDHYLHVVPGLLHHVALPCGEDVEGVDRVVPLALVEVVGVLGQTRGVDDAKVGVLGSDAPVSALRAGGGAVPRGGFAQVVEARPDVLAGNEVASDRVEPGFCSDVSPADGRGVVRGQLVTASVGLAPQRVVHTTAVDGRGGLRAVELPLPVLAVQAVVHAAVGVVDAREATCREDVLRAVGGAATLELVVAKRDWAGGVGLSGPPY